ncbi:MAG: heat shock protein HspQ [Gammaproteobacteria bacterium]|nr:heat shock protein HspQ [Gammaproteobacteria bacterium]
MQAKFGIGALVHHKLFDYRGVIVDVDATFQGSEDWYREVAKSRPPKDRPWYHVLVDNATHQTYVAERNLEADASGAPIHHPVLNAFFDEFRDGVYVRHTPVN